MTIRILTRSAASGALLVALMALAACSSNSDRMMLREPPALALQAGATPEMHAMIARAAAENGVPVTLVHRIVQLERRGAQRHG